MLLKNKLLAFGASAILTGAILTLSTSSFAYETLAKEAYVMDFETGTEIFSKNAEAEMGPSSMTKMMTAYIIFDALKRGDLTMESKVYVSERAWKTEGSRMFLDLNTYASLKDILLGIIISSGNDACVAVAETYSGSVENFAVEMNKMAKKMGLKNTNFVNPHGITEDNHYSSAEDLAIIAKRLIADFPEYYYMFSQKEFFYNNIKQGNRNTLLSKDGINVDGLKTGHTEASGFGITTSAEKDGRRIISVVNGLGSMKERIEESEKLLNYAFNSFKNVKLFDANKTIEKVEVWNGVIDSVPVSLKNNVIVTLPKGADTAETTKAEVIYKKPWTAPLAKNTHVASLVVYQNGKTLGTYPLYTSFDVPEAGFGKKFLQKLELIFSKF